MKKILLYTDTPQTGGAELQIFLLAKFLDKSKFTPILACSNYSLLNKWCQNFEKEGIKVIRLNVKHKHDPKHYFEIKKIIKEEEIDLLHAHVWNPASCRYAFFAAKQIPVITTEHDPFKLNWLKNFFKKRSLKKIKKIITVSKNNSKIIASLYPNQSDKIHVIHNGIDTTWWQSQLLRFTEENRIEIKEEKFHAHSNTLIVTTVSELHERKGQKNLIKAIPAVAENFPNTKFIFIGDGPEMESLKQFSSKLNLQRHVTFLGKQAKIAEFLKASDIFVLPSKREAFGLVNLEAMITPLPIVASKIGGIPEIVKDEETGLLVTPESHQELSNALKKLIENPEKRESMALKGKERVLKEFNAKIMAEKYQKVYDEVT